MSDTPGRHVLMDANQPHATEHAAVAAKIAELADAVVAGMACDEAGDALRNLRDEAEAVGLADIANTIEEIAAMCASADGPEGAHPASLGIVIDPATGLPEVVTSASPGELSREQQAAIAERLALARDALAVKQPHAEQDDDFQPDPDASGEDAEPGVTEDVVISDDASHSDAGETELSATSDDVPSEVVAEEDNACDEREETPAESADIEPTTEASDDTADGPPSLTPLEAAADLEDDFIDELETTATRLEAAAADPDATAELAVIATGLERLAQFFGRPQLVEIAAECRSYDKANPDALVALAARLRECGTPAVHEPPAENAAEAGGGQESATLDPNVPLDPAGAAPAFDPNVPLDPTGGGAMPDPNMLLDPSGGGAALDPNMTLDPTGAAALMEMLEPDDAWGSKPLMLPPEQIELLQFMVVDARQAVQELDPILAEAQEFTSRPEAADRLGKLAEDMRKANEFFSFKSFGSLVDVLSNVAAGLANVPDDQVPDLLLRVRGIASLLDQYCSGLEVGMDLSWPLDTLTRRIELLMQGRSLHAELVAWHRGEVDRVLELDGVTEGVDELPNPSQEEDDGKTPRQTAAKASGNQIGENVPSIRVPKTTVDGLLDIVRQLVLNKNQLQGLAIAARERKLDDHDAERLTGYVGEYAKLVDGLQLSMTETRMQPIGVILDRYERMVRDAASLAGHETDFEVIGGDTPVDKFVLDTIADPIGRVLRSIASTGIEASEERRSAGKPERGNIVVRAEDRGGHVNIAIIHDGRGPDADDIRMNCLMSGRCDNDQLVRMTDSELAALQFWSWYPEGEVSGIADVFDSLGGQIGCSQFGDGRHVTRISLPVHGAVIGAMQVRVGRGTYAIATASVETIRKFGASDVSTVDQQPMLRQGDRIIPLIDCRQLFAERGDGEPTRRAHSRPPRKPAHRRLARQTAD
ncbi:MAG: hypothetical protein AAF747_08520, partial [Planctomycetota bacterium]